MVLGLWESQNGPKAEKKLDLGLGSFQHPV